MEDKDLRDFLLDLPSLTMSKPVSSPHSTVSNARSVPKSMPDPVADRA